MKLSVRIYGLRAFYSNFLHSITRNFLEGRGVGWKSGSVGGQSPERIICVFKYPDDSLHGSYTISLLMDKEYEVSY